MGIIPIKKEKALGMDTLSEGLAHSTVLTCLMSLSLTSCQTLVVSYACHVGRLSLFIMLLDS